MTTVFVAGALANKPGNGGEAWVRLSWVLGLRRLGVDVVFVEQVSSGVCVDARGTSSPVESSANLAFHRAVVDAFGLAPVSSLIIDDGARFIGMPEDDLFTRAESAAALVNISGHLTYEPLMRRLAPKVYVDVDPGFTQYWHAAGRPLGLERHDVHLTVGQNVGTGHSPIPVDGISWRHVRPPFVLDEWSQGPDADPRRFTTVGSWRGAFGPVTWEGRTFGLKVHEFRRFAALPRTAPATFEIALDIHPADARDRALLESHGWHLVAPRGVAGDPQSFRHYVRTSGAEFSAAQGIYVETSSGWISDRTVHYLAAGRPVLVQDTGLGRTVPTGQGLLSFATMEEAAAGVREIVRNYEHHRHAARELAETWFDSDVVLSAFLEHIGVTPVRPDR
ncbi:hypothetical protein [Geodermatophilus sp. SYSU D01105]